MDDRTFEELRRDEPFRRLWQLLEGLDRAIVAYSGGVDSTFLLAVARGALGERAHGILACSESLDQGELRAARELAHRLGVEIETVETREYDNPLYRRNDGDRCYHCKTELFSVLRRIAEERGVPWVLDGSNASDRGDYRPGMRARDEQGVRSPLMEAGLDKDAIREYSRRLGLPTWDKPAAPCLSSRIPYGSEVTDDKLRQVESAERLLRSEGFPEVRVRHHGEVARIEVPAARLAELVAPGRRERVVEGLREAGFTFVSLDLDGFRSGSLNRTLPAAITGLVQVEPPAERAGRRDGGAD